MPAISIYTDDRLDKDAPPPKKKTTTCLNYMNTC